LVENNAGNAPGFIDQVSVSKQVGQSQGRKTALVGAQEIARTTKPKIGLCDFESIVALL
jgi:hypothetical protein